MTRTKQFFGEMGAALRDMWTANLSIYKKAGRAVARVPHRIKKWWDGLLHREYLRRTKRIHALSVWVREEDETGRDWLSHYYREADLRYPGLTQDEADALGEELLQDGHRLGLQLQVRSEVDRKYVF